MRKRGCVSNYLWFLHQKYTTTSTSMFFHVSIPQMCCIEKKVLMEGINTKLKKLEEPCEIYLLTKETRTPRVTTTDLSKHFPVFTDKTVFCFFNVEGIHGFTSTSFAICFSTSYKFGFLSKNKTPPLDTLKFLVITLRN